MKSIENLMAAFAGESQANRKYLAFAKKADEDGFPNIARLFRAAAKSETFHAHNHLKAIGELIPPWKTPRRHGKGKRMSIRICTPCLWIKPKGMGITMP